MEIVFLPTQKLRADPNQPRQTLDQERINEIAKSIKTEGVINPIEVDKTYTIVTGEMRWRSAKVAGLKEVPCKIIEINPEERFRRQIIENIHHNTMTDWDTAKALKKLLGIYVKTMEKYSNKPKDTGVIRLGRELGKSHNFVRRYLDILEAPQYVQDAVRTQSIPFTALEEIRRAPKEFRQVLHEQVVQKGKFSRDLIREKVAALKREPERAPDILAAKTVHQLWAVSPRLSDKIHASYNPVNKLSNIIDELTDWLKSNPPQTIGTLHAPRIIINLSAAVDNINSWGKQSRQLKLTKGD